MYFILFSVFSFLFCSDYFKGQIVDELGNPISGVNIELIESQTGTSSDNDGFFAIEYNQNQFLFKITHIGYNQKIIDASTENVSRIVLKKSPLDSNPIVVTGARRDSYIKDVPIKTKIITNYDIKTSGVSSVKELLELAVPNIQNVMSSHAGISNDNIKIQGLDNKYVLFLIDGARVSGEFAGNLDFNMLTLSNVETIEVVEGGMSSLYGSSAIGGVVNIITSKESKPFEFEFSHLHDSPLVSSTDAKVGFGFNNFNYSVNLSQQKSNGYDLTPDPIEERNPLKTLEEYTANTISHRLNYFFNESFSVGLSYKDYKNKISQYTNHLVFTDGPLYPSYYYSSLAGKLPWFQDKEYKLDLNFAKNKSSVFIKYHYDKYDKGYYFFNYTDLDCSNASEDYFCNNSNNLVDAEYVNSTNKSENVILKYIYDMSDTSYLTFGYEQNKNRYISGNIYSHIGDLGNGEYDEGIESFIDENGNNQWDDGEQFTDLNFNGFTAGVYDLGEPFIDCDEELGICQNDDGWDFESMGNGQYDAAEFYLDIGDGLCNGDCLAESIYGAVDGSKTYLTKAFFVGYYGDFNNKQVLSISLRGVDSKNYGNDLVSSAAYMLRGKKYNYRFNYSKGFRTPSIKELYYDFQSHPPPILGNPELKSTRNNYYSLSIDRRTGKLSSSFELFHNKVEDMIGTNYSDSDGDGQDDIIMFNNYNQVEISGFNFHYEVYKNKNKIKLIYNYTDPSSSNDGALELISKHSLQLRLNRELIDDRLNLFWNTKFLGKKFIMYLDDRLYLDSYSISDLMLSFQVDKVLSLNFGCKNIFNYKDSNRLLENDYLRDVLSTYNPGQRLFFQLNMSFSN